MHSGALRRAIGLTFLYIGVFVLLVFVQFSRGPGFSEAFGKLSIRATYAKADRGKGGGLPESVRLSYSGFTATISKSSPAAVLMGDGSRETLAVVALDKLQNGVRIRLDGGFELKAIVEPGAQERFVLSASGGGGAALPETVSSLSLGYRLGGRLRSAVGAGTVSFDSGGLPYSLHLSAATLDKDKGLLVLESRGGKLGGVAIERSAAPSTKPSPKPPAEQRISQAPKPAAIIKAEVDAWRDKVWNGLNVGRYDSEAIAWRDPDPMNSSSPVFTEEALCAYLAEALSRGSFPEALQRMRPAKERWADKLSYVSAPFMGGLVPRMQALEEADLVEVRRLGQLLQDRSPSIFEKEDLLHFLLDRAPYPIALDAFRFAAEIEPSKFTLRQAVGLLGCVVESRSYLRDEENPFAGSLGNVAETIAASIRKASEGFFLILEDEGSVDMRLSLLAGILLSEFGAAAGKDASSRASSDWRTLRASFRREPSCDPAPSRRAASCPRRRSIGSSRIIPTILERSPFIGTSPRAYGPGPAPPRSASTRAVRAMFSPSPSLKAVRIIWHSTGASPSSISSCTPSIIRPTDNSRYTTRRASSTRKAATLFT
jgi:hypothetical protein